MGNDGEERVVVMVTNTKEKFVGRAGSGGSSRPGTGAEESDGRYICPEDEKSVVSVASKAVTFMEAVTG